MSTANLRGRGGAGFPIGRKASLIARDRPKPKYVVVNADESEPGAFKDREIMNSVPAPADRGVPDRGTCDRVEGRLHLHPRRVPAPSTRCSRRRSTKRDAAGLFDDVGDLVHRGAGAYICGEETALLESLEGRRGQPRPRPPFPPVQGLYSVADAGEQRLHDRHASRS